MRSMTGGWWSHLFVWHAVGPLLGLCLFDVSNLSIKQSIHLFRAVALEGGYTSVPL